MTPRPSSRFCFEAVARCGRASGRVESFFGGVEVDAAADPGGEGTDFEAFFPLEDEFAPGLLDAEGGPVLVAEGVGFGHRSPMFQGNRGNEVFSGRRLRIR
jgi:hypothetical protein